MDCCNGLGLLVLAIVVVQILTDNHYIQPSVSLVSCLTSQIVLRVSNGQADGLMYIKDENTAYNMQFTENGTMVYSCRFTDCNLAWNTPFSFVIQRKIEIQTVHDVHLVFTCVWDSGDIVPDTNVENDKDSANTEFYIFSSKAMMKFYDSGGINLDSGSYIKLGRDVTMVISLENTYHGLLDISVKSCDASGINIIQDRCPLDQDLFDSFNKTSVGTLENIFQMFRTTSNNPEPVSMVFSCTLEVCYSPCAKYNCNGSIAIPETNRRKRADKEAGQVAKSMKVGTLFKVGIGDPVLVTEANNKTQCVSIPVFAATITVFSFLLLLSISALIHYSREWKQIRESQNTSRILESPKNTESNTIGFEFPTTIYTDKKEIPTQDDHYLDKSKGKQMVTETSVALTEAEDIPGINKSVINVANNTNSTSCINNSFMENNAKEGNKVKPSLQRHQNLSFISKSAAFRRACSLDETGRTTNCELINAERCTTPTEMTNTEKVSKNPETLTQQVYPEKMTTSKTMEQPEKIINKIPSTQGGISNYE